MKFSIFIVLLFLALVLESSLITLPLVFLLLLLMQVIYKRAWILIVGFLAGLFLDSLSFRPVGFSSIFFLCVLYLIFLYEKKFEVQTFTFVFFSALIGSLSFLLIFGGQLIIVESLLVAVLSVMSFSLLKLFFITNSQT